MRASNGKFKRGFFSSVQRRFFVLTGAYLTYYKTHSFSRTSADECLDLRMCTVRMVADDDKEYGQYGHHGLLVCLMVPATGQPLSPNVEEPMFLLFAPDSDSQKAWFAALSSGIRI